MKLANQHRTFRPQTQGAEQRSATSGQESGGSRVRQNAGRFATLLRDSPQSGDCGYGLTIGCGDHTYTFTSGDFLVVARDPSLAAHLTASHVWATDGNETFRVVGAETYSEPAGRLTAKIMFVRSGGGIADSINIVLRDDKDGNMLVGFSRGTCGF